MPSCQQCDLADSIEIWGGGLFNEDIRAIANSQQVLNFKIFLQKFKGKSHFLFN